MMTDKVHILVQAGNGGRGCESYFHRNDRKKVPNGGEGGNGGSVIFRADTNAPPIENFKYKRHLLGESGTHGGSNKMRGKNGEDIVVLVPVGTSLHDRVRNLTIRSCMLAGEEVIVAQGGRGGTGNLGGKESQHGEPGAVVDLEITFTLLADVYLVGLPNSGKTSILTKLTSSKAKVESYPFATQMPKLGVWKYSDYEQLTLCDMPSLYSASHDGRGRGNEFLKHLAPAKLILYVLDPVSEFAGGLKEGFEIVKNEVMLYNEEYKKIPYAIVINKIDLPEAKEKIKKEKWKVRAPVIKISVETGEGMEDLEKILKGVLESVS